MAQPILKWAGGKRQLLDELYRRFPESYDPTENSYHEPFFGGGALFFDHEPISGTINDINVRLWNLYIHVRQRPKELIKLLDMESGSFRDPEADPDPSRAYAETRRVKKTEAGNVKKPKETKNFYYQQRELFNRRPNGEGFDPVVEAAQLVYLNRTCFNGLYRENSSEEFNVPIGRYANPDWDRRDSIREASGVLNQLPIENIRNDSFEYVLDVAEEGDLVYFDPPYEPMSPTANFAEYSAGSFGQEDQETLLDTASELDDRGVHVILSNSGVMYDFYDEAGFHVETEGATRSINSDGENRDEVDEIIATNVPPSDRTDTPELFSSRTNSRQTSLGDLT
jgi:DNA adenine methylase